MHSTLLKNARLLGEEGVKDIFVRDGLVAEIADNLTQEDVPEINCRGHLLLPALMDMQVFMGGVGASGDDRLADLNDAALAGGVLSALLMPDSKDFNGHFNVPHDMTASMTAHFHRAAPITENDDEGARLAEMGFAHQRGVRAFCDGAAAIADSRIMRRAMNYAADMDALIMHQPLDPALAGEGMMNEGIISARLGLAGIPAAAEIVMVARDIELARMTGVKYHAAQISCAGSLALIRRAKDEGLAVSCGVSMNHLLLNEDAIGDWRTFCKLTPPLRTEEDRSALLEGVVNGAIDVIVSGHNPQSQETKRLPFEHAAAGAVGLETLLAGALTLHKKENIALEVLIAAMTINPARLLGLASSGIKKDSAADFVLCDMERTWILDVTQPDALHSQSQNAALDGRTFYGKPVATLSQGEVVFDARSN